MSYSTIYRTDATDVLALREQLWDAGFRPVPVYTWDDEALPARDRGKRPMGDDWRELALQDPPAAVRHPPHVRALNTGILCDGLRAIDVDVDASTIAARVRSIAMAMLGEAPIRSRAGSARHLVLYRAPQGQPRKRVLAGTYGKIEVLGAGQQFVAFGRHQTGADLTWTEPPGQCCADGLPAVTEDQIAAFLAACAPVINAEPPKARPGAPQAGTTSTAGQQAEFLRVTAALAEIPNDGPPDWEYWNKIGMAIWAATGGSAGGAEAFAAWSARHPAYDPQATAERWQHYATSPPTQIGAGTLFHLAQEARQTREPPPPDGEGDYGSARSEAPHDEARQQDDALWPEPLDFLAASELTGTPELRAEHLPAALAPFVFDTAARMGVDPAAVALAALVALASVISDDWQIQPKAFDTTWTEGPRLRGAIVGDPSMLKSPIIREVTRPIDKMEAEARKQYDTAAAQYRQDHKAWKDAGGEPATEPKAPRLIRYLVESTTTEALSEALRDDAEARQSAPAKKVLVRQDEMAEWVASFDRYRSGGRGGADRGAYLRLYNGGRYTIDRINRGSFAIPNWSACILGGIQPGPIRQIANDAADDGLLQRFCYCVPARQARGEDRKPDATALARYAALFGALAIMRPGNSFGAGLQPVVLHAEAHQHRLEILDLAEALAAMPDASDRLKAALGKWPGLWARLVLIFHLIDVADAHVRGEQGHVANVARGAATSATSYMRDILLPHLLRAEAVMFATTQAGHAHWIAGYILAKGESHIAARDIMRAYGALRPPEKRQELQDVMASLEAMGWVRAQVSRDARLITAWDINPKVHNVFSERAKREKAARDAAKARFYETMARHMARGTP